MKSINTLGSIALLLGATCNPALAGNIEQIVVTGMRTEHSLLDSPASISVITREDIEQSGALTIADVLRARAGIQIRDTIGDSGRGVVVSMRGFGENAANNTLITVDGRRLNNPTLQAPDLNSVALHDIERIEVLQGGGGVLFGDQAVGGVINIITRRATRSSLDLELDTGSHDRERYAINGSYVMENGFAGRISAEHRESDNYRDNNRSEYQSLRGVLEYRWADGKVFAEAQRVDDALEFPGALPVFTAEQDRRQSLNTGDFGDLDTTTLRAGGVVALSTHWSAELDLTSRDSAGDGYQFAANTTDMKVESVNPRLVGSYDTEHGRAIVTLGMDFTDSEYLLDIPDWFTRTDFKQEQQDIYAQLVYPISASLTLSGGIRQAEVDDDNRSTGNGNSTRETISTASLAWQWREDARVILRRDEVMRFANVDENGYTLPEVDFLKPQTGVSWEGGVEFYRDDLNGRAMLFALKLDDEILYDPSAPGPGAAFGFLGANINLDESSRQGAMLELSWSLNDALTVGGSYTYTDAEIESGTFKGNEVPYVAEHSGVLNTTWQFLPSFSAYAEVAYTGSRYALGDDANAYEEVDAETMVNLALRWSSGNWRATLRANNVFGEKFDTLTTDYSGYRSVYPAAEETVFLTLGYTL